MMFGYGLETHWLMWLFGSVMLAGVVVLIVVAVLAISGRRDAAPPKLHGSASPSVQGTRSRARQILDERFARGDLSADQYSEHLRVLGEE